MSNFPLKMAPGSHNRQEPDAPLAHRRPGYSLSGCVPAEPDSASPGTFTVSSFDACRNHNWTSELCLGKSHPRQSSAGNVRTSRMNRKYSLFPSNSVSCRTRQRWSNSGGDQRPKSCRRARSELARAKTASEPAAKSISSTRNSAIDIDGDAQS